MRSNQNLITSNRKRSNRKRTNRKRANRKRTNRKRSNRRRTNRKRSNRRRSNRKRTNRKRTNRKRMKGGEVNKPVNGQDYEVFKLSNNDVNHTLFYDEVEKKDTPDDNPDETLIDRVVSNINYILELTPEGLIEKNIEINWFNSIVQELIDGNVLEGTTMN